MKIKTFIHPIITRYKELPPHQQPFVLTGIFLLCFFLLILFFKTALLIHHNHLTHAVHTPLLLRDGDKIMIPPNSPLRTQLTIKTIHGTEMPHVVSFPGVVEANPSHVVNIFPPLTGRLVQLNVGVGDKVLQNQVLAIIRSPDRAAAEADFMKAKSQLVLAEAALQRAKRVYTVGANATKDVELSQTNVDQAQAELERSKKTLQALGKGHMAELYIKAPIDGTITALNYGIGSYITDATVPLLTLSNIQSIWITANIPENYVGVITPEIPVAILLAAYPRHIWPGKVTFVNSFLEPDTRRNKTRIALSNPRGKLQPNMYATVKMYLPQPNQIIIPISAVLMNNDNTSVFVETTDWTFIRRDIELGAEDAHEVRVLSGLTPGERIIVAGGVLVND